MDFLGETRDENFTSAMLCAGTYQSRVDDKGDN